MLRKLSIAIFVLSFLAAVGLTSHGIHPSPRERPHAVSSSEPEDGDFDSERDVASSPVDLESEIANFKLQMSAPAFDGARCAELLSRTTARLQAATPQDFAPTAQLRANYRSRGVGYVNDLFAAKLALRDRLKELIEQEKSTPDCVASSRELFRVSRILEDLIGEYALGLPKTDSKHPVPVFGGGSPYTLINPKYRSLTLQPGDVILSRGTAFTSAAISRIGNNDASFSHLTIVSQDPKTHALTTTEAQIEIGSFTAPIAKYLGDGKVRAAVFRYKDPALAARAAALIRDEVANYFSTHHDYLPYDSGMDMSDSSKLFCSELVSHAFALAGDRNVPMFQSSITPRSRYFVDRIGIKVTRSFLPMDIEVDPNFELVAEWRDFTQMNVNHMHDAILTAMFDWMDRGGYVFHDQTWTEMKTSSAYVVRRWPLFSTWLHKTVPACLSADQMSMVQTLGQISNLMYERLSSANEARRAQSGEWLTINQMIATLDQYRREDLELYRSSHGSRGELHQLFRP